MRSTKNILRVLACLAFVFILVFSFASCDKIKSIFVKHEHSYVPTVTQPTCTEQGYTTYTCECGESYKDNFVDIKHELVIHEAREATCTESGWAEYFTCRKCPYSTYEEIAPIGHDFEEKITRFPSTMYKGVISTICNTCGESTSKEMEAISVTLPKVAEIIRTFVGMNEVLINAKDTQLLLVQEFEADDGSTDKKFVAIELACFEINGKTDDLVAYISLNLGLADFKELAEGEKPEFTKYMTVNIVVNGDDVSLAVTENDDLTNDEFALSEKLYGYVANNFGISYEQLAEAYYLIGKLEDYLPVVEGLIEWIQSAELPENSVDFSSAITAIIDCIVYVDENGYSHLDLSALVDMIKSISDTTVADMVDEYFGKGTMTKLEVALVALPTTKIRTLAKTVEVFAQTYDIPLDDIYSLVNYVIHAATGADFNIEREIKTRYNKTVAEVVVELTNQGENITDAEINIMALGMVNSFKEMINLVKKSNIDQLYNYYNYGDINYDYSLTGDIISVIEVLDAALTLSWHTSEDGELDALNVTFTGLFGLVYDSVGENTTLGAFLFIPDGPTVELMGNVTSEGASLTLKSDGKVILSFEAAMNGEELLSATVKLNALYTGELDGYNGTEHLLNILTLSFLKGDGEACSLELSMSVLNPVVGETPEDITYTYENVLEFSAQFNGTDTLTVNANGKDITVLMSEADGVTSYDVIVKEGETVLADLDATVSVTYDDNGLVTDAGITLFGTADGKSVDMSGEYVDGVFNAICKVDGEEMAKVVLTVDEDGGCTADVVLDGVNVTSEILVYLGELVEVIENLGVIEGIPAVA